MRIYVWTVIVILAVDVLGKMLMIVQMDTHRSVRSMAIDAVFCIALMVWGIYLVAQP